MLVPNYYRELLHDVELCGATKAIIAGGAIRDYALGRNIADIDVFINGDFDPTKSKIWSYNPYKDNVVAQKELYEDNPDWEVLYHHIKWENIQIPVQIIKVNGDLLDHVKTFGCHLSQMWYDSENEHLAYTNEAYYDAMNFTLTFLSNFNHKYNEKIKAKYPLYNVKYLMQEELLPF